MWLKFDYDVHEVESRDLSSWSNFAIDVKFAVHCCMLFFVYVSNFRFSFSILVFEVFMCVATNTKCYWDGYNKYPTVFYI